MKRFFSLLLSVVMLFSMVAILPVAAEDVGCLHTDASVVNKTYITGGVVLSDYECTCGETWTEDEQGTTYTSVTTGCPGLMCRYETVWTATDGSGKTYSLEKLTEQWVDDATSKATGEAKNVTSAGCCQTCGKSVWMPTYGVQVNTSTSTDFYAATDASGTRTVKPKWDFATGGIKAAEGGKFLVVTGMGANVTSPYIFSFDLNVTDIMAGKNTATSMQYYPLASWLVTSTSEKRFLSMGATGTDASQVYLTLGTDYTFANGTANAICYLTKGEWYTVQIAVDPVSGTYWVYVNGEFVGMDKDGAKITDSDKTGATATKFQFGQATVTGPYNFGYSIKNMDLDVTDAMGIYTEVSANELIKIGYDYSSLTGTDFDQNAGRENYFGTRNPVFGTDLTIKTVDSETYGSYSIPNSTSTANKYYDFSMSTVSGSTVSDATVVSPFSGRRYEIKMDFAIAKDNYFNGTPGVNTNIIRLMKYGETVKSCLVTYNQTNGYAYMANGKPLYAIDGETFLTPRREFVDGVPQATETLAATSELRVVVDEDKGLYSVYVDSNPAYFYDGDVLKPFLDQPMPSEWVDALTAKGWVQGDQTFGDITYGTVSGLGLAGSGREYIRILQGLRKFAIKELTVSLIPDDAIELVGVQERVDELTFDVRFVAGVDDLYTSGIGFKVEAFYNGEYRGVQYVDTNVVYEAINEDGGKLNAHECPEGQYLTAFKIIGIERTGISNVYQFVVTPFYKDRPDAVQDSYTVAYNGEGQCLSNGKQWSEGLEVYEEVDSDLLLELTQGSPDMYNSFYVYVRTSDASGDYFVRYKFLYAYNTSTSNGADSCTNASTFRIDGATLVKVAGASRTKIAYTPIKDVLSSGEITLAIKEASSADNTVGDFIGGYHGDEKLTSFTMTADGVEYTPGAEAKVVACDELSITQVSELYRWAVPAGTKGTVAEHTQAYTIDKEGMKVDRSLKWLVGDFVIDNAYAVMFTMKRLSSLGSAICETVGIYDANGVLLDSQTVSADTDVTSQYSVLYNDDTREVRYSSADSGFSATVGFEIESGAVVKEGKNYVSIRKNSVGDNKWYVAFESAENGQTPVAGEVWNFSTYFHIDYVNPVN